MQRLVLRRVVLLGAPLALALLEISHPERPASATEAVEQGVWFMWFHVLQVPLIGLIALAVYLLTDGLGGGVSFGRASLPGRHAGLRNLLRGRCVAGVRTGKAHFS